MYFFTKKNLFIRLHKTGSTSLTSVLDSKTIALTPTSKNRRRFEKYRYGFKFTFIRNPFDRLVSSYFMVCKSERGRKFIQALKGELNDTISLNEFVKRIISYREGYRALELDKISNVYTIPWYERSENPNKNRASYEAYWVLSHTMGLVDSIEFFLPVEEIDFIGRYETLNDDYAMLRDYMKLKKDQPHLYGREDKKEPFQSYYDDETVELVSKMYRIDLNTFNYGFS